MADEEITVTKLDAATRQLRTAIRLWFNNGDPVAVHALAAAAYEIIHTLFRRRGLKGLLFDSRLIKDEYRAEFMRGLKKPMTFFKHAQRDPDETLNFNPEINLLLLTFAASGLGRMGEPIDCEDWVLGMWLLVHRPTWFPENGSDRHPPIELAKRLRNVPRHKFFEAFEILWRNQDAIERAKKGLFIVG